MNGTIPGASDTAGIQQPEVGQLIEELGDPNWRVRRKSIEILARHVSDEVVQQLVSVLRFSHHDMPRLNAAIQVLARIEADVVPALLQLLADSSAEVRSYSALALGERGDASAIPGLLFALHDVDRNVQVQAIESLGKLRASAAVDVLAEYAVSQDFVLAFPALDALASIGDGRIAHRLLPLLLNPLLKIAAIDALGALSDEEAIGQLVSLLEEDDVPVATVVAAIANIHHRHADCGDRADHLPNLVRSSVDAKKRARLLSSIPADAGATPLALLVVLSWLPGDEIDAFLVRQLLVPQTRQASKEALAIRGPRMIPLLLRNMGDHTPEVQVGIVETCARIGDCVLLPQLLASLDMENASIAAPALRALVRLGDQRLYPVARELLGHPSEAVRQAAIAVINTLGHEQVCQEMLQLLQSPSAFVRESAVTIALYAGCDQGRDLLVACYRDPEERVRQAVVQHLPCLNDGIALPILHLAMQGDTPRVRAAAAGAVAELDDHTAARQLLFTAVLDKDSWVRYFAVRALGQLEVADDTVSLLTALAHKDPAMHVRIAAVATLGNHQRLSMSLFEDLVSSPDDDLRHAGMAALGNCRTPGAAARLLAVATDHQSKDQFPAIRALGLMGDPSTVPALLKMAQGRNDLLADESVQALGRMGTAEAVAALVRILAIPGRRAAAVTAITSLGEGAISALAHGLQHMDADIDVQRAVVESLGKIRSPLSAAVLEAILESPLPGVRYATIRAISCLGSPQSSSTENKGSL